MTGGRRADVLAEFGSGSGREGDEGLLRSLRLKLEKTDPVLLDDGGLGGDAVVVVLEDDWFRPLRIGRRG